MRGLRDGARLLGLLAVAVVVTVAGCAPVGIAGPSGPMPASGTTPSMSATSSATAGAAASDWPRPSMSTAAASGAPGASVPPTPEPTATEARPTPVTSATPRTPDPARTATPPPNGVRAGAAAYVDVSVATGWHSPTSPRASDRPALANPARLAEWLAALTDRDRSELIGRMDTQVLLGERVIVTATRGDWAHVVVPDQPSPLDRRGYPVWVPLVQLTATPPPSAPTTATVVVPRTSLRAAGGGGAMEVSFGTQLPVLARNSASVELGLPGGRRMSAQASAVVVGPTGAAPLASTAAGVLGSARSFLGLAYLWSGTSGFGFDCSGLVYTVYRAHGVLLPRDGAPQAEAGVAVARADLRPGDLVFFARDGAVHHVAIYVGNGSILDAPRVGQAVRVIALADAPYAAEYSGARRVLP